MKHITITGSLGSGKTVVSKLLNEYLGFEIESIGSLQRKMAQKYGMSTFDFNKYKKWLERYKEISNVNGN